jgi:ATP-binding cassette subfamily B protein
MIRSQYRAWTIYARLLKHARPYWGHLAAALLLSLLAAPLTLLTPLPLKVAADSVVGHRPLPWWLAAVVPSSVQQSAHGMTLVVAGLVLLIALLGLVQQMASRLLSTYCGEKLVLYFRSQLFHHVQRLSLAYHDSTGSSDSAYRIQYDAPAIQWLTLEGAVPLITSTCTLLGMIYVMMRVQWQLALVALSVAPMFLLLSWLFGGRLRSRWREAKQIESSALSVVHEALSAARLVKSFRREEYEENRFASHSQRGVAARLRAALSEGCFGLLVGLCTAFGMAAVLVIGLGQVRRGVLSFGDLLLAVGYLGQLYGPLKTIGKEVGTKQREMASAERALSLLDEAPEVHEKPNALPLRRARGRITLDDVCFSYDGQRQALRDVSFDVPAGASVGIQGKTGAGKSTLMNLLMRFYDPSAGRVLLDGVDLRDYRLHDLRDQFSVVLQDPVLFSSSIAENIAYGRPGASEADVVKAARAAHAHEFISRLPDGYDTRVGERGACLSGGERQRIALARAFLKDAPVLILDEPTSAVDVQTEAMVMDAVRALMQGRTTFVIAHRLSTLDRCDIRLKVDSGTVTELLCLDVGVSA